MKRMLLFFGLVLCLSATVHAGEVSQAVQPAGTASLDSFLAELAMPSVEAPQAPKAIPATSCYASTNCPCGGYVECWGDVSCMVRPSSVICDGYVTECPPIGSCVP